MLGQILGKLSLTIRSKKRTTKLPLKWACSNLVQTKFIVIIYLLKFLQKIQETHLKIEITSQIDKLKIYNQTIRRANPNLLDLILIQLVSWQTTILTLIRKQISVQTFKDIMENGLIQNLFWTSNQSGKTPYKTPPETIIIIVRRNSPF